MGIFDSSERASNTAGSYRERKNCKRPTTHRSSGGDWEAYWRTNVLRALSNTLIVHKVSGTTGWNRNLRAPVQESTNIL